MIYGHIALHHNQNPEPELSTDKSQVTSHTILLHFEIQVLLDNQNPKLLSSHFSSTTNK